MKKTGLKNRIAAAAMAAAMALSMTLSWIQPVQAADVQMRYVANEDLAPGIHYSEEDIQGYGSNGDRRIRVNHLTVDPSAEGVEFNSTRAEDTINARENILNQAMRDVYQGVNVVASVNADPYNMDYGLNSGIQVRSGAIVTSQPNNQYTTDTPVFFVDGDVAQVTSFFASSEVDRIYINFCDPWPGSRHAKRRLTHPNFLQLYRQVLTEKGEIHFKTDNRDLFEWSLLQFPQASFSLQAVTRNLHANGICGVMTDYEEKFHQLGMPINRCEAVMELKQGVREASVLAEP